MKKIFFLLLVGLALCPTTMDAKRYRANSVAEIPGHRPKAPALYHIGVDVDAQTGDIVICPNYDIVGLAVTIEQNGTVYEETTVSLSAGSYYATSVADYDEGDYTLTLTNSDGDVIGQYTITVEDD